MSKIIMAERSAVSIAWAKDTGLQQFVAIGRRAVLELPEFPPVILALQIRWENGIAHRANIAEIGEEAWMAAGPTWKLIALA
jgi:hypothetical protein